METKMIRIERSAKMETAIARCKANHPKVRRVDATTVTVYGSRGKSYTVRFAEPKPGLKLAACDCPAGQESKLCYHIPAAVAAPVVATVERSEVTEERETLVEMVKSAWHRARPFAGISDALRQVFGVTTLDAISNDDLRRIHAALQR